jgi:hypothetical protein
MADATGGAFLRHFCGRKDAEIAALRHRFGPKEGAGIDTMAKNLDATAA